MFATSPFLVDDTDELLDHLRASLPVTAALNPTQPVDITEQTGVILHTDTRQTNQLTLTISDADRLEDIADIILEYATTDKPIAIFSDTEETSSHEAQQIILILPETGTIEKINRHDLHMLMFHLTSFRAHSAYHRDLFGAQS